MNTSATIPHKTNYQNMKEWLENQRKSAAAQLKSAEKAVPEEATEPSSNQKPCRGEPSKPASAISAREQQKILAKEKIQNYYKSKNKQISQLDGNFTPSDSSNANSPENILIPNRRHSSTVENFCDLQISENLEWDNSMEVPEFLLEQNETLNPTDTYTEPCKQLTALSSTPLDPSKVYRFDDYLPCLDLDATPSRPLYNRVYRFDQYLSQIPPETIENVPSNSFKENKDETSLKPPEKSLKKKLSELMKNKK